MKYLVEVIPESITDFEAATSRLATTLKLDPAKAAALLKRNPITKPVSQAEAEKVARLFTKAGIEVFIRGEEETNVSAAQATQTTQTNIINVRPPSQNDTPEVSASQQVTEPRAEPVPPAPAVIPQANTRETETKPTRADTQSVHPAAETQPTVDRQGNHDNAKIPSVVPEIDQASAGPSAQFEPTTFARDMTGSDESFKVPSGFFTPVPESESKDIYGAAAANTFTPVPSSEVTRPRGNVGRLFFASLLPGLLALAGVFTALYLFGLPFLHTEQRMAAQTTAVSIASSIGGWIGDVSLDNPVLSQQVQNVMATSRPDLQQNGIRFVLVTDAEGNQLAGWYNDTLGVPDAIMSADSVRNQISNALAGTVAADSRLTLNEERLELAAHPVRQGTAPVGAVVVGMNNQLLPRLQAPLINTLLAGLVPLVLGILISLLIVRTRS